MKRIALAEMTTTDLVERFAQIGVAQGKAAQCASLIAPYGPAPRPGHESK